MTAIEVARYDGYKKEVIVIVNTTGYFKECLKMGCMKGEFSFDSICPYFL